MEVFIRFLKLKFKELFARTQLRNVCNTPFNEPALPYNVASWKESLLSPSNYYLNCVRYFYQGFPLFLQMHRRFFKNNHRGFGEDAFHVMWHALVLNLRPKSFLEIGVYRGQSISLVALISQSMGTDCSICGVSPFTDAGDSVSKYLSSINYMQDTLKNFQAFRLPVPTLIKGRSDDRRVVEEFSTRRWDLIYIDGNHDYEFAKDDFLNCSKILTPGGKIILDDSALFTTYRPPLFATAGHPGPSRLAMEIPSLGFQEVLRVGHNRVFQKAP